jgi:phosphodiesterase/alkaline phosphatase D-like protein
MAQHGAKLNGHINPLAWPTVGVTFQYGKDANYGSFVSAEEITFPPNTESPVTAKIVDLEPDTDYHFQAVLTYDNGSVIGGDQMFHTPPDVVQGAPTVVTDPATEIF